MMENKVTQIRVEGQMTGIIGLESVLAEIVQWAKGKEDAEITAGFFRRIEKRNYIPSKLEETYGKALLGEYKKFIGEKVMM